MKIKQIEIKDFGSIYRQTIAFSPDMNVLYTEKERTRREIQAFIGQLNNFQTELGGKIPSIVSSLTSAITGILHQRTGYWDDFFEALNGNQYNQTMSSLNSAASKGNAKLEEDQSEIWQLNNQIQNCRNEIERLTREKIQQQEAEAAAAMSAAAESEG